MNRFPWPTHVNSTVTTMFSGGQEPFTISCLSIARYKELKLWTYNSTKEKKQVFQVCIYNLILSWSLLPPYWLNLNYFLILAIIFRWFPCPIKATVDLEVGGMDRRFMIGNEMIMYSLYSLNTWCLNWIHSWVLKAPWDERK